MKNVNQVTDYWKNKADSFNKNYEKKGAFNYFVNRFLKERLTIIESILRVEVKQGCKVIDVGCGGGEYLEILFKMGANITGVDYSDKMLLLAENKLIKAKCKNYSLIKADATDIKTKDNEYDIVLAVGLLDYVKNTEGALREIYRIIKPNGLAIITIPKNPSFFSFLRTPIGTFIRRKLFNLPQIIISFNNKQILSLVNKIGFELATINSIQTTMWIISCRKRITN